MLQHTRWSVDKSWMHCVSINIVSFSNIVKKIMAFLLLSETRFLPVVNHGMFRLNPPIGGVASNLISTSTVDLLQLCTSCSKY